MQCGGRSICRFPGSRMTTLVGLSLSRKDPRSYRVDLCGREVRQPQLVPNREHR
jgi:hypothetical protein